MTAQEPKAIKEEELNELLKNLTVTSKWHPDIKKMSEDEPTMWLPGTKSSQFKMVNFLAHNPTYAFSRNDLLKVAEKLNVESGDIIQTVNKTTQWGLQRWTKKINGVTYYAMPEIKFITKHTRAVYTALDSDAKALATQRSRDYFKALAEESNYEIGHMDPRKPLGADNFVMQPSSINRPHKDKYIFDNNGLPKVPNPERFIRTPETFYSLEDLKIIYEGLKKFFDER